VSKSKPTNGERLAVIETKVDDLCTHFTNHLHLHGRIVAGVWTMACSLLVAMICFVARLLWTIEH